jgi:hypothetical protein
MNRSAQKYLLFILLFASPIFAQAQRYGTAAGLRFGNSNFNRTLGVTLQQRIVDRVTLEAILQSDFNRNTTFSLLAEKHSPIISKRFNLYYGAGIAFGNEESFVEDETNRQVIQTYGNSTVGVDLIAGVELTALSTVFSLDFKPNINLSGREEFVRSQIGISARRVLVKSKEQKRKQKQRQKARNSKAKNSRQSPFGTIFQKN